MAWNKSVCKTIHNTQSMENEAPFPEFDVNLEEEHIQVRCDNT
jgi:hypothetical protein